MSIAKVVSAHGSPGPNGGNSNTVDSTGGISIIGGVAGYNGGGDPNFSDNKSNTYTPLGEYDDTTYARVKMFYCPNATCGAGHIFTSNVSGSYPTLWALVLSGTDIVAFYDSGKISGNHDSGGGTSIAPGSVTPSENNCILAGVIGAGPGSNTFAIDSGFTLDYSIDQVGGNNIGSGFWFKIQTTAGAANPSASWASAATSAITMASFKSAGIAGKFGANSNLYKPSLGAIRSINAR